MKGQLRGLAAPLVKLTVFAVVTMMGAAVTERSNVMRMSPSVSGRIRSSRISAGRTWDCVTSVRASWPVPASTAR